MKILITGTHSTGKSSLLFELSKQEEFKSFVFVGGVTREAKKLGFEINENGDVETQFYCLASDILNLLKYKNGNVVYDRSILDTYVYTQYLFDRSQKNLEKSSISYYSAVMATSEALCMFKDSFDLIFWLRPEFKIEDDGVRSIDEQFQKDIDDLFEKTISEYGVKGVHILSGTTKERIEVIKQLYNEVR